MKLSLKPIVIMVVIAMIFGYTFYKTRIEKNTTVQRSESSTSPTVEEKTISEIKSSKYKEYGVYDLPKGRYSILETEIVGEHGDGHVECIHLIKNVDTKETVRLRITSLPANQVDKPGTLFFVDAPGSIFQSTK